MCVQREKKKGEVLSGGGRVLVFQRRASLTARCQREQREEEGNSHGPERVGGKVADGSHGPVDVLQNAPGVIGGLHAEVALHLGVPDLGKVLDLGCEV